MSIYLGFDTSNYTTSTAAVRGNSYQNSRRILDVAKGGRGLRQSDALFCHVKQLGEVFGKLDVDFSDVAAVGVSTRPRNVEGSYMPVFLAGITAAQIAAKTLGVPLYEVSHQEGHIMAAVKSAAADELLQGEFLSVHLSGGTTEILRCRFNGGGFDTKIIGGTRDISAGQLIDRAGVMLGLKFPAGQALDELSQKSSAPVRLPVSTDGAYMNFSGTENKIAAMLDTYPHADIALGLFDAVAKTLAKTVNYAVEQTGIERVALAGGVMCNTYIRKFLENNIRGRVYFASPELARDNAVGTAYLAQYMHNAK